MFSMGSVKVHRPADPCPRGRGTTIVSHVVTVNVIFNCSKPETLGVTQSYRELLVPAYREKPFKIPV